MRIFLKDELAQTIQTIEDCCRELMGDSQKFHDALYQIKLLNLQVVGDSITDGVFVSDSDGVILYVNKANQNLVGITAEECLGKHHTYFEKNNGLKNVVVRYVLEHKMPYSSIIIPPKTGIHLLEIGSPILDQNEELVGCIVIDKDISATYQLTEELRLSKSRLARYEAVFAHESSVIDRLNQQNLTEKMAYTKSKAMEQIYIMAEQAAKTTVTVLLQGETGTGKEVIANHIFEYSQRCKKPFVKVNCAAIPENLLESELFGYEKGAFTGASIKGKPGMFELANEGTLFLDEVGELPLEFQAKLLRVIQQQEIIRVGGTKTIKLDIRLIAATNRNLKKMVEEGTFREDLYYRLNIFPIRIPALRERKEDISAFIQYFLEMYNKKYGKHISISPSAMQGMTGYDWPGNIRELENMIERWVVIYEPWSTIKWEMIANHYDHDYMQTGHSKFEGHSLKEIVADLEKEVLLWANETYGSTREMAKVLQVDHSTIVRKARGYGIKLSQKQR